MTRNNFKFGFALVVALGSSLAAIGCGDDSGSSPCGGDNPFPRDGVCFGDGGSGGGTGVCNSSNCPAPASCNSSDQCTYNGTPTCGGAICASGTVCDTSTNQCKVPSGTCTITCGVGTVCDNGVCKPGGSATCNSTNCPSPSYCSNNTCVNSGSCNSTNCPSPSYCNSSNQCVNNGDGGSGGGTGSYAAVTWKNSISPSGNGWVDVSSGTDGSYTLGLTAGFAQSETAAVVCFIGYGSGTLLTCNGACEWWNPSKSWLGAQVGKNPDDLSYMTSQQASKDAASRLLTYRATSSGSRPANAYYWRAGGKDNTWVDNEAIGSSQSAIHCAYVSNNGTYETH